MDSKLSVTDAYASALKILADKNTQTAQLGEAIQLLSKIREGGFSSPQLEANLGRAYGRLENWPQSIFHFEEALRQDRWSSEIREDLVFAQEKIQAGMGLPLSHPAEWGYRISSYVRSSELFSVSFACLWVFLYFWYQKRRLHPKIWVPSTLLLLALFSASFFSLAGRGLAVLSTPTDVALRSAPLENAEEIAQVRPGTRLRVLRSSGAFSEVERPNAFRGWVESKSLRSLNF